MTAKSDIKTVVKAYAREVGFDLVGIASAQEFAEDRAIALERLRAGLMQGLPWYHEARIRRGTRPEELLPGARSIICLGLNYYQPDDTGEGNNPPIVPPYEGGTQAGQRWQQETPALAGKVARYAWGQDYHRVMKQRMRAYVAGLSALLDIPIAARWYVDDGPMLDRAAARRAGLGWFGKNTNILTPSHGSWVFLGQVITDLELEPDPPLAKSCGSCVRCIEACPTGAIVAPYVIDNARCISYLTIENRGPIPRELRPLMLDWVFGCDICQDVCPVNRKASPAAEPAFQKRGMSLLGLVELLELAEEEFRSRFQGSPILRAKRIGLQRNACVALGNRRDPAAVPALRRALANGETLVRGHAAWALGQIGDAEARSVLEQAALGEADPQVVGEIEAALEQLQGAAIRSRSLQAEGLPGIAPGSWPS
jgi:epoxyqueuosine reductase